MKRLIGLSVAVIIGVTLTTVMLIPRKANAVGGLLFGQAQWIEFGADDKVNYVVVKVNNGWLNSDNFTLGITITGLNGGPAFHGYQEVHLSASELLGVDGATALIGVEWTTDLISTSAPENYTVCTKVMDNGAETCNDFLVE